MTRLVLDRFVTPSILVWMAISRGRAYVFLSVVTYIYMCDLTLLSLGLGLTDQNIPVALEDVSELSNFQYHEMFN